MVVGRKGGALAIVCLFLAALPATSQPSGELNQEILNTPGSDITFYGHVLSNQWGGAGPMPMNTQFPYGAADLSQGYVDPSCNYPPAADPSDGESCYESYFFYTTAGFVQVKSPEDFSYSKIHNERGQTKDIYFDTDRQATGTLYMSADNHPWLVSPFSSIGMAWNWDPGYLPDMVVESWIWHANLGPWASDPDAKPDVSPITSRSNEAILVAHGATAPKDLWSLDPTIPSPTCEGECQTVHPFTVEYEWDADFIDAGGVVPFQNDLIIEYRWYELDEATGEKYWITHTWNLNGGEDYPPTMVLPTRNPLDVELVFPRFVHDKLVILSVLNTPWGSYDVDLESIDLEIRDGAGQIVRPSDDALQQFLDVSVAHSGHYDPINVTWIWDYQDEGLKAGDYEVVVSATNFQGSYSTQTVASFTIEKDGSGGDATAAQSGLLTFTDEQFESYKEGAGAGDDTQVADNEESAAAESEAKESPGAGVLLLAAAVAVALLTRRSTR